MSLLKCFWLIYFQHFAFPHQFPIVFHPRFFAAEHLNRVEEGRIWMEMGDRQCLLKRLREVQFTGEDACADFRDKMYHLPHPCVIPYDGSMVNKYIRVRVTSEDFPYGGKTEFFSPGMKVNGFLSGTVSISGTRSVSHVLTASNNLTFPDHTSYYLSITYRWLLPRI